jgi:hypothetical protein
MFWSVRHSLKMLINIKIVFVEVMTATRNLDLHEVTFARSKLEALGAAARELLRQKD